MLNHQNIHKHPQTPTSKYSVCKQHEQQQTEDIKRLNNRRRQSNTTDRRRCATYSGSGISSLSITLLEENLGRDLRNFCKLILKKSRFCFVCFTYCCAISTKSWVLTSAIRPNPLNVVLVHRRASPITISVNTFPSMATHVPQSPPRGRRRRNTIRTTVGGPDYHHHDDDDDVNRLYYRRITHL